MYFLEKGVWYRCKEKQKIVRNIQYVLNYWRSEEVEEIGGENKIELSADIIQHGRIWQNGEFNSSRC